MKKFLIKVFLYGSAILTIIIAVVSLAVKYKGHLYSNERVPIIKASLVSAANGNISLILGSSHTFYGIDSKLVGRTFFNLSSPSQSLYEDFQILKSFVGKKRIDTVILPFSYFSNHFKIENTRVDGEAIRIFDYEKAYGISYKYNLLYVKNRMLYNSELFGRVFKTPARAENFDSWGNLMDSCKNALNNISDYKESFLRHSLDSNFSKINPLMDSIIELCKSNNIYLCVIAAPVTSQYRKLIATTGFSDLIIKLEEKSKGNYSFFDCRNYFTKNEEIYFRDADHLSPCGRNIFSKYLGQIIASR